MRFQPGIALADADQTLTQVTMDWDNVRGGSLSYHDAVAKTYPQLRRTFAAPDLAGGLRSNAYWQLLQINSAPRVSRARTVAELSPGIEATRAINDAFRLETETQLSALEAARRELNALKALAEREGLPIVCDTNILVAWKSPDQIDWRETLREQEETARRARLIVPLRVVDELDKHKKSDGRTLAERAATAIRYLERTFTGHPPGAAVTVRDGATLEIWTASDERDLDPDLTILGCAAEVAALHPATGARVMTNDYGMRLRAQQMGLPALRPPAARYAKPGPGPATGRDS